MTPIEILGAFNLFVAGCLTGYAFASDSEGRWLALAGFTGISGGLLLSGSI